MIQYMIANIVMAVSAARVEAWLLTKVSFRNFR
jgi:hypothetical protein